MDVNAIGVSGNGIEKRGGAERVSEGDKWSEKREIMTTRER